jgi:CSLREA domain-containing protein
MDRSRVRSFFYRLGWVLLSAAVALPSPLLGPPAALADTVFEVNTVNDSDDNACAPLPAGDCSLREAIKAANATPGKDTIKSAIPGDGVHPITPKTPLPNLTEAVIIDGYSQAGAQPNTTAKGTNAVLRIELDGSEIPSTTVANGLTDVSEQGSLFRGLVINTFEFGIVVRVGPESPLTIIEGNFIGTDATGDFKKGNGHGVYVYSVSQISTGKLRIGGAGPAARNLISGNLVGIALDSFGITVQGNLIGTNFSGEIPFGNSYGIFLDHGGGTITDNVIAFNTNVGIHVFDSAGTGNRFDRNAIFGNGGIGIDLNTDGPTPNDPGDTDLGPNNLQNFPVLSAATSTGDTTTVSGAFDSLPNREFLLQFFTDPNTADAEGKTFLGEQPVNTDGNGHAGFTFTVDQPLTGQAITATATNVTPNDPTDTSELSAPLTVRAATTAAGQDAQDEPGKTKKKKKGKKGKGKGKKGKSKHRVAKASAGERSHRGQDSRRDGERHGKHRRAHR